MPIGGGGEPQPSAALASAAVEAPRASEVDWAALSERSQATLRLCFPYLLLGWKQSEIAAQLGVGGNALADALAQLREELEQKTDA